MLFEGDNGWKLALWISVILNVNLAILNMLRSRMLDGGHIVSCADRGRARKPVNMKILDGSNRVRHAHHWLHALQSAS